MAENNTTVDILNDLKPNSDKYKERTKTESRIEKAAGIRTLKKGAYAPEKSSVPDDNNVPSSMYRQYGNRAYVLENARKTTRKTTDFSSVKRRKDLCL